MYSQQVYTYFNSGWIVFFVSRRIKGLADLTQLNLNVA